MPELGIEARIGINTGEVVTGTEERLATGDAVNVAARLEQAAPAGEVLLGGPTFRHLRDVIEAEPVEPLTMKGKERPVEAYRLVAVSADVPARPLDAPIVGRATELAALREAWARAQAEERCVLATVVGDAGIGKSRLAAELVRSEEARVLSGRCLPYGDGITYWPVVEVVRQLADVQLEGRAAGAIRALLGDDVATTSEEIDWAFRKLLEEAAPVIVLVDDIQWAEETLLDLLEKLHLLSSGAAILLVCLARPDLVDRRAGWPVALRLEPLEDKDAERLIEQRLGRRLDGVLTEEVLRRAGGNPLFVEEMTAMLDEGGDAVGVPPSLQALLAARLDQLEPAERGVLERGAVEGEVFHSGAVRALAPEEAALTSRLTALVRRELITPAKPQFDEDDAFRFRHLLIRDAAYGALPKATRAELHELYAAWLAAREAELAEVDEIVGYHLEQAARYKQELAIPDAELAERAGRRLAAAGRRALWRGDDPAAASLLERALGLLRPLSVDVALELDLADALGLASGSPSPAALSIAESAAERAAAARDRPGEAVARARAAYLRMMRGEVSVEEVDRLAGVALPLLERAGDHANLIVIWDVLGTGVANTRGRYEDWSQAAEQMVRQARLAGQQWTSLFTLPDALTLGPRPADEALRTIDDLLPATPHAGIDCARAVLLAMLGRFEDAWPLAREANERLQQLTGDEWRAADALASIAQLAGDYDAAARHLRLYCELLEARDARAILSTYAPMVGRVLCALGRFDEAEPLARRGRELGDEHDLVTQALWRQVQARVDAARGERAGAERLAYEAVAITEGTDGLNFQGDALCDLAEVLALAGCADKAAHTLRDALDRYERKRNLAMVAQVRERLARLHGEPLTARP